MSRTSLSLKNAQTSLLFTLIKLILGFLSRKVFLDLLGNDLVGLSSTLNNILGFLNLAELGISLAVTAVLYEPVYNKDQEKISDLVAILSVLFKRIAFFLFISGFLFSFFLPIIFSKTEIDIEYIYACYFSFLFSSIIGYLFNYKQNLIEAEQKNYIITSIYSISQIFKLVTQIIALKFFHCNFYIWVLIEFIAAILNAVILYIYTKIKYPSLNNISYSKGVSLISSYPEVNNILKKIIPHKFAGFVLTRTDDILVFMFVSLNMVAKYNNYYMIVTTMSLLVSTLSNGMIPIIGNLVVEKNKSKTINVFNELLLIFYFLAGIIQISFLYLVDSFISLWIGDSYILSKPIVLLFIFNLCIVILRIPITLFLHGHKLYNDIWAPWLEVFLNLSISLIIGYYYGVIGILLGTTISMLVISMIWKPYYLFSRAFNLSIRVFCKKTMKYFLLILLTNALVYFILDNTRAFLVPITFYHWIIYALYIVIISSFLLCLLLLIFAREDSFLLFNRIKTIIRRS